MTRAAVRAVVGVALFAGIAAAQSAPSVADRRIALPFRVGEELVYKVKFGRIPAGTAHMKVVGVEDIRGHPSFHVVFTVDGGVKWVMEVHDRWDSWIDTVTLASRRHVQDIHDGRYQRHTRYEIFPEEKQYQKNDEAVQPSVALPLDEGSFIYFMRTARVPVGQAREFHQYFMPDRNPVVIRALRRDTVEVPSGRYPAVVVRPTIRTKGLFAEDGEAQIWFSDDAKSYVVQMQTKFAGFSLSLQLAEVH
ncbi:MAG: hypothetical protein JWM95_3742 [Gemmatimonadetes bacterium]|nr:hypothetical protein [Gemmatimonadota bacterium]